MWENTLSSHFFNPANGLFKKSGALQNYTIILSKASTRLQDLNNKINEHDTLCAAFFTMEYKEQNDSEHVTYSQVLIESIHNTGNPATKVVRVPPKHYHSTISQLTAVHSGLQAYIDPSFHDKDFIRGTEVCLAGQKADSISSCTYAAHINPYWEISTHRMILTLTVTLVTPTGTPHSIILCHGSPTWSSFPLLPLPDRHHHRSTSYCIYTYWHWYRVIV